MKYSSDYKHSYFYRWISIIAAFILLVLAVFPSVALAEGVSCPSAASLSPLETPSRTSLSAVQLISKNSQINSTDSVGSSENASAADVNNNLSLTSLSSVQLISKNSEINSKDSVRSSENATAAYFNNQSSRTSLPSVPVTSKNSQIISSDSVNPSDYSFADVEDSKTVRVGYYENEVFQEGTGNGAVKNGYAYEYYRKISEYTGWNYEYVYGSFTDLYEMFLNGEIDLMAGLARTEEREDIIGYPDAPMGRENYNLIKHDTDTDITTDSATLNGKKFAVLNSAIVKVLENFLKEQNINAEVVIFDDNTLMMDAFDSHEVDIVAAEDDGAYSRNNTKRFVLA